MIRRRPGPDILARTFTFSCNIVRLAEGLMQRGGVGRLLVRQVLSAGTSIGANVEEAQAGQSKADFVAKMCVALKEARESHYWLRLVESTVVPVPENTKALRAEAWQLALIIAAIIVKARSSRGA